MLNVWCETLLDRPNEKYLVEYLNNIKMFADGLICIGHHISTEAEKILYQSRFPVVLYDYRDIFHEGFMRGKALELAKEQKADFLVIQDSDELMSDSFTAEIRSFLESKNPSAITCPWVNFWNSDKQIRIDGYWKPESRRRIKVMDIRRPIKILRARVHYGPKIESTEPIFDSTWFCKHYGYMEASDRIRKNGRWRGHGIPFFDDYENQIGGIPTLIEWNENEPYELFKHRVRNALGIVI